MKPWLLAAGLCTPILFGVSLWNTRDSKPSLTSLSSSAPKGGRSKGPLHPSATPSPLATNAASANAEEAQPPMPPSLLGRSSVKAATASTADANAPDPSSATAQPKGGRDPFAGASAGTMMGPVPSAVGGLPVELAPGVRLPIVLLSFEGDLSAPALQSLGELGAAFSEDLLAKVADSGTAQGNTIPLSAWHSARTVVDRRFRKLYGSDAYNRAGIAAALEAMGQRP